MRGLKKFIEKIQYIYKNKVFNGDFSLISWEVWVLREFELGDKIKKKYYKSKKSIMKDVKCTIFGDYAVGKTSMINVFINGSFYEDYIPNIEGIYNKKLMVNETIINLDIIDTSRCDCFLHILEKYHLIADVFMLCFSIDMQESLENITKYWFPLIKSHCPEAPFILVGMKIDKKNENTTVKLIEESKIEEIKQKIKPLAYIECSSKINYNIINAFEILITEFIHSSTKTKKKFTEKEQNRCLLV